MTLKKITGIAGIALSSVIMTISSCDPTVDLSNPVEADPRITNYTFNGSEGDPITLQTALSWYANYSSTNNINVKAHFFGANVMKKILATSNVIGIRIYYSIDDGGNNQLLLIGADDHGNDQTPLLGAKGISSSLDISDSTITDTFTGLEETWVSEEVSKQWIANYASRYPQGLIAHFFGFQIINQILNETDCIGIRMYYALNDSGVQQILLVGVNSKGENILPLSDSGGKVMDGGNTVADASFPCPTYCSGGGGQ
jgi:hypothetical protein